MANERITTYNKLVKEAYQTIYKQAKQLLSTIEQEELRFSLERENRTIKPDTVIREFVNPLFYLRLECDEQGYLCIHYGFEEVINNKYFGTLTARFVRTIYSTTDKGRTTINIEAAVITDWLIRTCSEMYEYLEERNKYHHFKLLPYKGKTSKRKLQAVA